MDSHFSQIDEVNNGINYIKENTPSVLRPFREYRRIQPSASNPDGEVPAILMRHIHLPPMFPPRLWSMHKPTINEDSRTNNVCESWTFGFSNLI